MRQHIKLKNMNLLTRKNYLPIFLWLIAVHSFLVGLALIISPLEVFEFLGYNTITERFFPTQGGVFHILMSVCYAFAVIKLGISYDLVEFAIIVKVIAGVVLFSYFLFVMPKFIILFSKIEDAVMAVVLWWIYSKYKVEINS